MRAFRNQNFMVTWFTNSNYKFIGSNDFSFQFREIITRYRRIGYKLNVVSSKPECLFFILYTSQCYRNSHQQETLF